MRELSAFVIISIGLLFFSACTEKKIETKAQQTAIHYLYEHSLISDTLSRILWHPGIDFRGLDRENGKLYFIAKKELGRAQILKLLTLDTSQVEFAPCDTGICEFGSLRGRIDGYYAFRFPTTDLKVDTLKEFDCKYYGKQHKISFRQIMEQMDDSIYYHTDKEVDLTPHFRNRTYAANIGYYISLKDKDAMIKTFAEMLTFGLNTKEQKAQALLDYVASQIEYSYEDHWYEMEICKRAHEVLLSGDGDCSSKTVLFASLLEQCDIPYCLLYFDNHVNVGLQGNFPLLNGYHTKIKGTLYVMAETTVAGFVIGKTTLSNPEIIQTVLFYQNPRQSPFIFNAETHQAFDFVKVSEEEEVE